MKINATEIRVGMILEHKDDLWEVLKTQHVKPGKGGAFAQVEMKSLNKNTKINERFRSSENVEKASLELFSETSTQSDGLPKHFLDLQTGESSVFLSKILVTIGFSKSNKEAKRLIAENGIKVNDELII